MKSKENKIPRKLKKGANNVVRFWVDDNIIEYFPIYKRYTKWIRKAIVKMKNEDMEDK